MKIVIIYRYFWPDTPPYASMLRHLALRLAESGHQVTILCGQPSYGAGSQIAKAASIETISNNLVIKRCPLVRGNLHRFRILTTAINWLIYFSWTAFQLLAQQISHAKRPDLFWTASIPPIAQGLFVSMWARLARRPMIYHVQDVYPEAAYIGKAGKQPPKLLRWLDNHALTRSKCVVSLSDDMIRTMRARSPDGRFVKINNFSLSESTVAKQSNKDNAVFRFVFAGNMGRFQSLEQVVEAAVILGRHQNQRIEIHFIGHGKLRPSLEELAMANVARNTFFHDFVPVEEIGQLMSTYDAGIVSLQSGMLDVAFPSKTFTYWSQGLPVFVLGDGGTELERLIVQSDSGILCSSRQPEAIAAAMITMTKDAGKYQSVRERTKPMWSMENRLAEWDNLVRAIEEGEPLPLISTVKAGT